MKITHILSAAAYCPPVTLYGGVERVVWNICSFFSDEHDVNIICPCEEDFGKEEKERVEIHKVGLKRNIPKLNTIRRIWITLKYLLKIRKTLSDVLESSDIIHIHSPNFLFFLLKFPDDAKIVFHLHEPKYQHKIRGKIALNLFLDKNLIFKEGRYIIAQNTRLKNSLKNRVNSKVVYLPPGVNTEKLKPMDVKKINNRILIVAAYSPKKNWEIFFDTMKEIRELVTVDAVVKPQKELKKLFERYNIKANLYKDLPRKKLIELFNKAELFFLPSRHENFGLVFAEAMACGTPCVALKGSGGPEDIINSCGILSKPEELARDIKNFILNKKKLKKYSKLSRERIIKKFSLKAYEKRILNFYKEMLK